MLEIALPRITPTGSTPQYASYDIEPLEAGYGRTLGNALRRVLLSSLPGAAVTSIKIEGVQHEFQDVPQVKEDVTDIVLNVKKLRLRSFSDRPVTMRIDISGEREVHAADIQVPSTIELVNPEQLICTLDNDDAHLEMELTVETGKGYVPAESHEDQPIGVIPVDAIYSPVQKVNYTVENTRVGQMTNYDKIVLEVWTDGTITPDDAIRQAAQVLVQHFQMIAEYGGVVTPDKTPPIEGHQGPVYPIPQRIFDTPIEELDLTVRSYNCLKRSGITRVGQVLMMNEDDLLAVRNFGEKSLQELRERLAARSFLPNVRQLEHGTEDGAAYDGNEPREE